MFVDMLSGVPSFGAPEFLMGLAALAEMGHYYNLPVFGYAGCSDSKVLDQQAAIESAMSIYMAALTGSNLVHDVCYLESAMASSYEMVVLGNEIIDVVKQMMKGIEFNAETMAVDVIDQLGPAGNYLEAEHTFKHYKDNWYSELIDRRNYEGWERTGKLTMGDRLNRKAKEILDTHTPEPFPEDVQRGVHEIIERAEARRTRA